MAARNFSGTEFRNKAAGFQGPTQLPYDEAQRSNWQSANRVWWESTPMRYAWREPLTAPVGTKAYFEELDSRFLASVYKYMPWKNMPFEALIPFDELADKDVLEIGTGLGTHAQLLSPRCRSFTGIDLTETASVLTGQRLQLFGLPGRILRMDAEDMQFASGSFDYIWSWGVIHHSADTRRILAEMKRVLRPGRKATVMVYHRTWWAYYFSALLRGMFHGQLKTNRDLHKVAQAATDGAIARYYTPQEWREVSGGLFEVKSIRIYGLKAEVLPIPAGALKQLFERLIPDAFSRLLTNRLRLGSFLVARMRRAA
ncbi:MAG: class I SAM-dependent methyltransferase [Acetobacteraceae bacterium]|nr:class I SAM-dependent methyltransferase [Acetobacteraceae bacterium]